MYHVIAESVVDIEPQDFWAGQEQGPQPLEEIIEAHAGLLTSKVLVCRLRVGQAAFAHLRLWRCVGVQCRK